MVKENKILQVCACPPSECSDRCVVHGSPPLSVVTSTIGNLERLLVDLKKKAKHGAKKPVKPQKPQSPKDIIEVDYDIAHVETNDVFSLDKVLKLIPEGVEMKDVLIVHDFNAGYYEEENYSTVKVMYIMSEPNPHLEKQTKDYERKLKAYEDKMKRYEKLLKEWKREQDVVE